MAAPPSAPVFFAPPGAATGTSPQYLCGDRQGLFPDQFRALRHNGALRAWQLLDLNSGRRGASRAGAQPGEQVTQQDCCEDPWLLWRV
ncbi:hypothetical protein [Streptomyces sp. NPDC086023]|uniref:hypothetical protein n=1 Tax=Streptomyces sp. NPDC086023 TaxID=3365746 RepID=UPI0037D86F99